MPSYLNVYNTTLEPFKTQFKSKGYRFLPRGLTKIPEEFEFAIPQYEKHGLVVIRPGDDLQAKEREGLLNYLGYLMEQKAYFQMYIDEKKRGGVTVDVPHKLKQIDQWIQEIKEKYQTSDAFAEMKSFKDEAPMDAKNLFAGELEVKTVSEIVRNSPKKPKSFSEVNINEEIKN